MMSIEIASELTLDVLQVKKAALHYRALNHPLRQQMLRLLHQKRSMTVTELYCHLLLEQSVASQHLAILRKAGLVTTQREGKFVYYAVCQARLHELQQTALLLTAN